MNPAPPPQPPQPTTIVKCEDVGLAAISLSSRIPEFWTQMPRLWFYQFESTIKAQKLGDAAKADLVTSKLGCEALQQVSDILFQPQEGNRYDQLKERLMQVYEESADQQFQKLVGGMELGAQKPTFLLRRMKELGRSTQVSDKTIHSLWLQRLPAGVRAVLTVSNDQNLDNLAIMADKIVETMQGGEVAAVSGSSTSSSNTAGLPIGEIVTQMAKMNSEIAALREEVQQQRYRRSPYRGRGRGQGYRSSSRHRSQSRSKMTPEDPNWLCRHHYRYRENARSCEKPCAWRSSPARQHSEN